MMQDFEDMLYLFGEGAIGVGTMLPEHGLNVDLIRKYAIAQGIWPVVYTSLSEHCDVSIYQNEFLKTVSKGITRNEFTLRIIKQIEDAGIEVCLLKGMTVSMLYKNPDCRISGDTDILIALDNVEKTISVLKECGYTIEEYLRNSHHIKAHHTIGGLLEIHISLYRNTDEQIVFNGLKMYDEPYRNITISGYTLKTLGFNDGLIYLTAHFIKHLVKKGSGIRQVMDLLLYIREYEKEIDFGKYNDILKELRYDKLVDVIKSIGAKYFGLNYPICSKDIMDRVLLDMKNGGVFGFGTNTRSDFYDKYCQRRTELTRYKFKKYFEANAERSLLEKIFPKQQILMATGYNYAKKKYLFPVAWVNRYFDLILRRGKEAADYRKKTEVEERLRLMRDLNMID